MVHKQPPRELYATTIGPEQDTLIIACCDEWINADRKIACESGWVDLENMR
jgi:carbonic anhydrase